MVPKFEEFFLPCLKCLSDGKIYTQAMLRAYAISYFHLKMTSMNWLKVVKNTTCRQGGMDNIIFYAS